jgi:hypothetical protein
VILSPVTWRHAAQRWDAIANGLPSFLLLHSQSLPDTVPNPGHRDIRWATIAKMSKWDKFHLRDFSRNIQELLDMGKQPKGALSKFSLKPADNPELTEGLPDV